MGIACNDESARALTVAARRGRYRWIENVLVIAHAVLLFTMIGCGSPGPVAKPPPFGPVAYQDLIRRYNYNLDGMTRLWARAVVELTWHDKKGRHYEQGDGNLIVVLPDKVALSIGKLGHQGMWVGCNSRRYWLFDLRGDDKTLYWGRHTGASRRSTTQFPLPIHPLDLVVLTGMIPIDLNSKPAPKLKRIDGDYACIVGSPDGSRRTWIDVKTARPVRIDLSDAQGVVTATSRLSRWEPVTLEGVAPGDYPWIATRLELSVADENGEMTLFLSDPTDGRADNRIKDQVFDLDQLTRIFKPSKRVDLDAED